VRHFEVVVIGNDLSGLVAGALLAKSGRRVLLLDPAPVRSTYKYQDLTFFRHIRLFSGWDASPAQKRALFDLNLISDVSRRMIPLEPSFQVVLPTHRLDIARDDKSLSRELEREFPGTGLVASDVLQRLEEVNDRLDKLLDGRLMLPPERWRERRAVSKILAENPVPDEAELFDGAPTNHPLRRFAEMPLRFLSRLDGAAGNPLTVARAARQIGKGLFDLPGGLDELKEMLAGVVRHFHGEAREEGIAQVTLRWRRITSFHLASGEVVGCDQVIGAEPAERLFGRLPHRALRRRFAQCMEALRPTHRIYVANLAVHPDGIPEGMGPIGFAVRNPEAPLIGENLLLWLLHGQSAARRGVTVACVIPESDARDQAALRGMRRLVLEAVECAMPFLPRHLESFDVPWQDGEAQGEGVRPVDEMDEIFAWDGESPLGVAALPHRTPVKNLVLASRENLPALGLEGEFLAGISAARLLRTPKERKYWAEP
jgi:hypothetical protein